MISVNVLLFLKVRQHTQCYSKNNTKLDTRASCTKVLCILASYGQTFINDDIPLVSTMYCKLLL